MIAAIDRVQVFFWSLDVPDATTSPLLSLLSDDERARARRLVKPQDGSRFIVARAGLRRLLAGVVGSSPRDLDFAYSPFGKPALQGQAGVQFNLSHAEGTAVLAVTRRGPVGIDIEKIKPFASGIEDQFLAPAEIARMEGLSAAARDARLVEAWTAKEALIKLRGDSEQLRPREIELDHAPSLRVRRPEACAACSFVKLDVEPGHACILAMHESIRRNDVDLMPWACPPADKP